MTVTLVILLWILMVSLSLRYFYASWGMKAWTQHVRTVASLNFRILLTSWNHRIWWCPTVTDCDGSSCTWHLRQRWEEIHEMGNLTGYSSVTVTGLSYAAPSTSSTRFLRISGGGLGGGFWGGFLMLSGTGFRVSFFGRMGSQCSPRIAA